MAQAMVQLHRATPKTQWGFRLQGGRDFSSELSVKKVEPGSPADGQLVPGDNILTIGNQSTREMSHMQANNLIKSAGSVIQFTITRGMSTDFSNIKPTGPIKFSPWKHGQGPPTQSYLNLH